MALDRHLKLDLATGHGRFGAIEFGGWDGEAPPPRVRIAFRLEPDDYRGGDAVQLVVVHREPGCPVNAGPRLIKSPVS